MAITVRGDHRIFNIETAHTSYQMTADPHGVLLHLYYGPKAAGDFTYALTYYDRGFSGSPYDLGNDRTYSLDALPQEYPTEGTGDFRAPALIVRGADGAAGCDLRFQDYKITDGKYTIPGLPAVYGEHEPGRESLENMSGSGQSDISHGDVIAPGAGNNEEPGESEENAAMDRPDVSRRDGITASAEKEESLLQKAEDTACRGASDTLQEEVTAYGVDRVQTLEIHLADQSLGLHVCLLYGVLPALDIITRSVRIENRGESEIHLEKALAANLDFMGGDYDILSFYGRHGMERNLQRTHAHHGEFRIGSRRGTSSHQYNPLLILAEPSATETQGISYAMEFVYSGGFNASVEVDQYNQTRMQMGLAEHDFDYPLAPGEIFYVPEVILTASDSGFETLSQNLQDCLREHVCRGPWKNKVRPVLLNSWEGCYFNFNGEKIRRFARDAADLGAGMFVLDDGWFGKRDSDSSGLGDWSVNEKKLGGTMKSLIDDIHGMGLLFGLWFEPEMVSEDSDLFRAHPDWALMPEKRHPVRGRYQLVLDFSRPEVVDEVYAQVAKVVSLGVDYLKWDYNRSVVDVFSHTDRPEGKVLYDYILGLYRFLEKLNHDFPDLLIEGCSGGGGRFDAGMLYYTPQIWCSDNTDAIDRLRIQYGTSFGYPASAVGAHVSAVPNEQSGRVTSLDVRAAVAMAGTFGYELNTTRLTEDDKEEIRDQIRQQKRLAPLILRGKYFRLTDPFENEVCAWEFLSRDGGRALITAVTQNMHCNNPVTYVKARGLVPGELYRDTADGKVYPADGLMRIGLPVPNDMGVYRVYQWELEMVESK